MNLGFATAPRNSASSPERSQSLSDRDGGWDALQLCLAVYLLTSVARLHVVFPAFGALKPTMLSALGALFFFANNRQKTRRIRTVDGSTLRAVVMLGIWIAATIPFAINQGRAFNLLTDGFLQTALMFAVGAASVRNRFDLERLLFVYLMGGVVYSAVVVSRFGGGGRLNDLVTYDANDYATWMVSLIPLAILFTSSTDRLRRWAAIAALPVLMMGFGQSESRGGFLALAAAVAFLMLLGRSISTAWKIAGVAVLAIGLSFSASEEFWERMRTLTKLEEDYNSTSETGRMQIWERGLVYYAMRPVFGVGADNFSRAEGTLSPLASRQQAGIGVKWTAPHNTYLQAAVELGTPGLILFLMACFGPVRRLGKIRRSRRAPLELSRIAEALQASLVGFLVGAFFLSLAYSSLTFSLISFALATEKLAHGERVLKTV